MPKKTDKLQNVIFVLHKRTGYYRIIFTAKPLDKFSLDYEVKYLNDFSELKHKRTNTALIDFAFAFKPFSVSDFEVKVICKDTPFRFAKNLAREFAIRTGTERLLTSGIVKTKEWGLKLNANNIIHAAKMLPEQD